MMLKQKKKNRFSGGNSIAFASNFESEGSGSSGRIDTEIAASQCSMAPGRKWINLNSAASDGFAVPIQLIPLFKLSPSDRKNLVLRLRYELEQIQMLQKKIEMRRTSAVTVSSSSDILSCSNATKGPPVVGNIKRSAKSGKKSISNSLVQKSQGRISGTSVQLEPVKQTSEQPNLNASLLKQCENLLKKLMTHQHGWVFNEPVDVVKLKIPDYFKVIKQPMDLGTIKKKLSSGQYSSPLDFLADVRLTFSNAMTYNPPGNDVHFMADTMNKFFEMRWKFIEKRIPENIAESPVKKIVLCEETKVIKPIPSSRKRKVSPVHHTATPEPPKQRMSAEDKDKLSRELEASLGDLSDNIIEFLKEQTSNGVEAGEDEIEIDIDVLSDDTLFKLRKLLDVFLQEKKPDNAKAEPCEIELQNESGFSNSSMQLDRGNDLVGEEVDICGNELPVSSYSPVEIKKEIAHQVNECTNVGVPTGKSDSSCSSEGQKAFVHVKQDQSCSPASIDGKEGGNNVADCNKCISELEQLEHCSEKMDCVDLDGQEGEITENERQSSPGKLYRAALLKNRFADTILKAREKALGQVEKGNPEKVRREKEEIEMQRRKEKARLEAEAKAAEEAQKRAEEKAAAEAKKKREVEREAARQALLKMEQTVEINENSRILEDLEMLRVVGPPELPPSSAASADETSPEHSQDGLGLGSFKFGSGSNPLEQLGLFMKADYEIEEEECEAEAPPQLCGVKDIEEGEIN
nr:transcription factor GTE8-like [Ipomoea batatas]